MKTITCKKCNTKCLIDGNYPKFFSWCEECEDYAKGFDCISYATEWISGYSDWVYDTLKDQK